MRPKIYLFGDSITEESFRDGGWGSSLVDHFCRTADVVLRGYNGYNTRWALMVKEKSFPPPGSGDDPAAVTVFFGANDAALADRCRGFLHVPPDEYKQNLLGIVAFLKKQWPSTCIILITPPPIDEAASLLHPYMDNASDLPDRTNEAAGIYAKQCLAAAAECGLPSINLWEKMQQFSEWGKAYLSDGVHLNRNGNNFLFEEVVKQLKEAKISLEALPADLLLISMIDPNHPLKAFESFL